MTRNILIAEDDPSVAEIMARSLGKGQFKIIAVVPTGEAALQRVREFKPDLVIMDVILEGNIDGIEAGHYIEKTLNIPVIYITGFPDKAMRLEEQGKVPLVKPFRTNDLTVAMGTAFYRTSCQQNAKEKAASKMGNLLP